MYYATHTLASLREQFANVRRGELTPFYSVLCNDAPFREWVSQTRNLADNDAVSRYLGNLGTSADPRWFDLAQEFLTREPATWPPAPEPEPESRQAQARALAVMRRREQEAIAARDTAQAALAHLRSRVDSLMSDLLQEAEERDWCSEYDSFAENYSDIGMRVRDIESEVTVTVNLSFTRTVTHPAAQLAEDALDKDMVTQWVAEFDYAMADYAIDEFGVSD